MSPVTEARYGLSCETNALISDTRSSAKDKRKFPRAIGSNVKVNCTFSANVSKKASGFPGSTPAVLNAGMSLGVVMGGKFSTAEYVTPKTCLSGP